MTEPAAAYDLFVAHAAAERAWVDGFLLPALGLPEGRALTPRGFRPGAAVPAEFERAVTTSRYTVLVLSPSFLADEWASHAELLASYAATAEGRDRLVPLLKEPCELPLRVDFRVRLDCTDQANWEGEAGRLRDLLGQPEPGKERIPCPYPGLTPFGVADQARFFGRRRERDELLQRLRKHPFLTVIGPSGSGKSSLVFAGLVPDLGTTELFGAGEWRIESLRPGEHPAATPTFVVGGERGPTVAELAADPPTDRRLLLVVDQFEEVFTVAEPAEAAPFQEALVRLAAADGCFVVLTVRADFYPELMACPLWPEVQAHRLEVLPLDEAGLREAIARPAESVGVAVEEGLVERLVADAAGEPGVLPLVQETLVLLWAKRERRFLPLRAYEALAPAAGGADGAGRVTGLQVAMAQHADAVLAGLRQPGQEAIARRIFLRLIQFGEGRADTRRQQPVTALQAEGDDPALFRATLDALVANRLLTVSGAEKGETDGGG
jgi:hypothetical protein